MNQMNPFVLTLLGIGAVAVVGVSAYLVYKKREATKRQIPQALSLLKVTNVATIERTLELKEVLAWFRGLNLSPQKHTLFIGRVASLRNYLTIPPCDEANSLFLGVYDEENNSLVHHRLIVASHIAQDILDLLGKEPLVVLQ